MFVISNRSLYLDAVLRRHDDNEKGVIHDGNDNCQVVFTESGIPTKAR
jgi:hypothetical protein